jgi:Glycosyl transferase family 2
MGDGGVVTVCIPAYEAGSFIDRTLRCARAQTHEALRILVSIDVSGDNTEAVCRRHADDDDRVEVLAQPERLGWAGNVNFLLDRADSEFAFLYFHDDVIEPTYCERLVGALRERPDAASAHSDLGRIGDDTVISGGAYAGPVGERLLDYLTGKSMPSLLRSVMRTELAGDARLPTEAGGVSAQHPFLVQLVAAGPVVHIPEVLYRRWHARRGGLVEGWNSLPFEEIIAGYRRNAQLALGLIDQLRPSPEEREALLFGLMIHMTLHLRRAEARHGTSTVHPPEILLGEFAGIDGPPDLTRFPARLQEQCEAAWSRVERRTAKLASRR